MGATSCSTPITLSELTSPHEPRTRATVPPALSSKSPQSRRRTLAGANSIDEAREEEERLTRAVEIEREAAVLKAAGQVEEAAAVQQEAEQVLSTPAYVPPPKMAPAPKTKNAMRMIIDRDRLQTIADMLNNGKTKIPPNIPGVRFFQKWEFEVYSAGAVPESYRKPS